jgi:hypothetical protein
MVLLQLLNKLLLLLMTELLLLPDTVKKSLLLIKMVLLLPPIWLAKTLLQLLKKGTAAAKDGAVALTENLLKLACCYRSRWQPMALLQLLKN